MAKQQQPKSKSFKKPNDPLSWLQTFDLGPHFLDIGIPYIPMNMRDIESYVRSPNYEKKCIKKIETIGILEPIGPGIASLISTREPEMKLTLDIANLTEQWAYPIETNGICRGLRHAYKPIKIFGNLKTGKNQIILVVDFYTKIECLVECEAILAATTRIPRRGFDTFKLDPSKNEALKRYRNRLKKKKAESQATSARP